MVFKHLQSCGNLARTIRIGTLYFTISISTMSNACSYPSVRFPSRLVGWETDLDCNVGLWASRADDVVSFASLSGPEATRACTFTHNPIASASSLFEHIHRVNISFTLLFSKTVFQFCNWPYVLANPAWPWNFLRMNSKRTKCSQLWAERVKISLASLSGSGGTGAQCMFTRLWVLRDSLNCWRQRHCYSASALTQHQLNCSVTLIKIWYQVSADSEAAIKLLEYTGNASFQCPPLSMDVTPNYTLPHFLCLFWSSQSRLAVKRDWGRSSLKGKCIVCNCKDFSGSGTVLFLQWNWLHLFNFSTLCVSMCLLKVFSSDDA